MSSSAESFTQLQAAQAQLERALALYLDERDYLSAITLAGAADEVLGKMLEAAGGKHRLHQEASAMHVVSLSLGGDVVSKKEAIEALNQVRDWLKHYKDGAILSFDARLAAREMLERAVANLIALTNNASPLVRRFDEQR